MKRLISLLLSLLLLLTPVLGASASASSHLTTEEALGHIVNQFVELLNGRSSGVDFQLTNVNGETVEAGFSAIQNSASAHFSMDDLALLITESATYLSNKGEAFSVGSTELLEKLMELTGVQSMPAVTEEELQLLVQIVMELVSGVLQNGCVSYSARGNMINLHIDLDSFLRQLDAQLPQVLNAHQQDVDALLQKYTPFLFGSVITLDQLINGIAQIGLKDAKTGLTLDAMVFVSNTGMSLIISCSDYELRLEITQTGFAMSFTTPDGKVYPFNSNDLLTILGVVMSAPVKITEEAFRFEQTQDDAADIVTTHMTVDLSLLERDVKEALITCIKANSLSLDRLCTAYQPWVDLFFSDSYVKVSVDPVTGLSEEEIVQVKAPVLSAEWLTKAVTNISFLPRVTGEATVVVNNRNHTIAFDGYLGQMLFEGDIASGRYTSTFNIALRSPDAYRPFEMTLNGHLNERNDTFTMTLACSESLGGFNSITWSKSINSYPYGITTAITTDTDFLHFVIKESRNYQSFSMKLSDFTLDYDLHNNNSDIGLHAAWPNGYADLTVTSNSIEFASPILGFSYDESYDVYRAEGYINEDGSYRMRPTRFSFMLDNENEILTASIMPYYDAAAHLTYRTGRLSFLYDETELVIADMHFDSPSANMTEILIDGERVAVVTFEIVNGEDVIVRLCPPDPASEQFIQLALDFNATGKPAPEGAVSLTPSEFIQKLNEAFYPAE